MESLIQLAPHANARLLFLVQWRAGLRISEALALEAIDLNLDGDNPTLRVTEGKGGRSRVVPVHPCRWPDETGTARPRNGPLNASWIGGARLN